MAQKVHLNYFKVNLLGTAYTLEYCRKNNIKKIIAACSFRDVSGAWGTGRIITEDEPRSFKFIGDHAAYIISKNASNDLMDYYNLQHDMQCACFRFPRVYGIGPNNIGSFYAFSNKGEQIYKSPNARKYIAGITNSIASCTLMIEMGRKVFFSVGSEKNLKLTTVDDIDIFKALLAAKRADWLKE